MGGAGIQARWRSRPAGSRGGYRRCAGLAVGSKGSSSDSSCLDERKVTGGLGRVEKFG